MNQNNIKINLDQQVTDSGLIELFAQDQRQKAHQLLLQVLTDSLLFAILSSLEAAQHPEVITRFGHFASGQKPTLELLLDKNIDQLFLADTISTSLDKIRQELG